MQEIWKDIPQYEGLYQVSSLGRIKSNKIRVVKRSAKNRILVLCIKSHGYATIVLSKNNVAKSYRVHRLVAQSFIPNHENKPEVNHKNLIKTDNRIENLEWCTAKENCDHLVLVGRKPHGENHWKSKLNKEKVLGIIQLYKSGVENSKIASTFGITISMVYNVTSGKLWKSVQA